MKFLIDEDVPVALLKFLRAGGHEALRVEAGASDAAVIARARAEGRILITLDADFTNTLLYPPAQCPVVHIQLHPPLTTDLCDLVSRLLTLPTDDLHGLILLRKTGLTRISG